jgi:ubiquitin-protein ligase
MSTLKGKDLLQKEFNEFLEDPDLDDYFGIDYWDEDNEDILSWRVVMYGPPETIYEGGYFLIKIDFNENYPTSKPNVNFKTKIYHTNVNQSNGHVCISTLNNWENTPKKPSMKIVLEDIYSLLSYQNPFDGYSIFKDECIKNYEEFKRKARQWVIQYANVNDYDRKEKNY